MTDFVFDVTAKANVVSAVLYAVLGMLLVALIVLVVFYVMKKRGEENSLERYLYVQEKIDKVPDVQSVDAIAQVQTVAKQRHGKKNKNRNRR